MTRGGAEGRTGVDDAAAGVDDAAGRTDEPNRTEPEPNRTQDERTRRRNLSRGGGAGFDRRRLLIKRRRSIHGLRARTARHDRVFRRRLVRGRFRDDSRADRTRRRRRRVAFEAHADHHLLRLGLDRGDVDVTDGLGGRNRRRRGSTEGAAAAARRKRRLFFVGGFDGPVVVATFAVVVATFAVVVGAFARRRTVAVLSVFDSVSASDVHARRPVSAWRNATSRAGSAPLRAGRGGDETGATRLSARSRRGRRRAFPRETGRATRRGSCGAGCLVDGRVGVGRSRGRWRSRRTSDRGWMVRHVAPRDARARLASPGERPCRRRRARRRRSRPRASAPFPERRAARREPCRTNSASRPPAPPLRPRRRDAPPARRRASRTAPPGAPSAPSAPRRAASPSPSRPARRVVRETCRVWVDATCASRKTRQK